MRERKQNTFLTWLNTIVGGKFHFSVINVFIDRQVGGQIGKSFLFFYFYLIK